MAKQQRSVWEVRFRSLMQTIKWKRENLVVTAGRLALTEEGLQPQRKAKFNNELAIFDDLIKRGEDLEETHISRIYLYIDS